MRRLSDTIARLAALRAQAKAAGSSDDGEGSLSAFPDFGSNPGALKAKTYVPTGLGDGAPLVVVLHGCTQTAAGYDLGSGWSALADAAGFALLFPEQVRANNPNLCFNWFLPEDAGRGSGEALSIRQMIEAFAVRQRIDRKRVFITGLSAGGAMTAVMLATYPELFAGGAVIAGLPFGSANTVPEAFDRMRGYGSPSPRALQDLARGASDHAGPWPILSVWHGDADRTVAAGNMDLIVAQWQGLHGVTEAPTSREIVDGQMRRVWCDASGRAVIESITVAGMGHGTPLSSKGETIYGKAGPFMLDAGISSTLRIAEFWGIVGRQAAKRPARPVAQAEPTRQEMSTAVRPSARSEPPRRLRDVKVEPKAAPQSGSNVQDVIERALPSARLMK